MLSKISDDLLKWIWAVREQENLWLKHDAFWVDQAKQGWPNDSVYRMLISYGLLRGKKGACFAGKDNQYGIKNREILILRAKEFSDKLQNNNSKHNTKIWKEFDNQLCDDVKFEDSGQWFLPSATLKTMWFFKPNLIPMYDRYAVKGLKELYKKKGRHEADDFIERCYKMLENEGLNVCQAKQKVKSSYEHDIRILDKYLWLIGSERPDEILQKFKLGLGILEER